MKSHAFRSFLFFVIASLLPARNILAVDAAQVIVTLEPPAGNMKMGETPAFVGTVTNVGETPVEGMVVYLSLVSLKPGKEQPVDLEDWSAEKALRIDRLLPGETKTHAWSMRLIEGGKFGVALTVVDPKEEQKPIVSPLVHFDIQPKRLLESKRILPVAIGEPLLLLALWGATSFLGGVSKKSGGVATE
jgi:hypothetical protein